MMLLLYVYIFFYGVINMVIIVCFKYFKVKWKNFFLIFDLEILNIFKMNVDIFFFNILYKFMILFF